MIKLIMFAFNKISYKVKRETIFLCYIYTNIYTGTFGQQLGRKYKALHGIVMKYFFFCLSPSQKTMESILGNAFSSVLGKHSFKIFLPLSAHHGAPSEVTKYATNNMPKRSLSIKLKSGPNLDVLCL